MFNVLYVYDNNGQPQWVVMPSGTFSNAIVFDGALDRTTGSAWLGANYNSALFKANPVGALKLNFSNPSNVAMRYSVHGFGATNFIVRQQFRQQNCCNSAP